MRNDVNYFGDGKITAEAQLLMELLKDDYSIFVSILPVKMIEVLLILPWGKRKHKIALLHTLFFFFSFALIICLEKDSFIFCKAKPIQGRSV